jgi:uncharacterized membrane-anchored protein
MKTRIIVSLFVLAVLAQLWVPASMIVSSEKTLESGKAFKFRTAPVDPYDAFRGKYVALQFTAGSVDSLVYSAYSAGNGTPLRYGQKVYAILAEDSSGFAKVIGLQKNSPGQGYYIKAKVNQLFARTIVLEFPFSSFFLEEGKAKKAEELYRQQNRTGKQDSYAIIRVDSKGRNVIEDLVLGGIRIKKALR